ncbi:MAG: RIP metalloprotease RseP [Bacteroidales bacterium]|nr:RIP metalloprotease RseP [Bacteroidales bacterium]MBQ8644918.1 RIP metalloprotease RseP [Bacteroidales bacterium]MBR2437794.1 RIP metalloprotease RseP [Bacteroidales bacterium]
MVVLIKILQLVLALSILVLIHEFGHFLFARIFKIRVEKFYLFFDPWFSLFKYKPKNSDTEYGIGWLPLGGYCKIAGMIDESMDKEAMAKEPQPWEYRSKPAWQRFFVIFGGVLFNFILAIVIYTGIMYTWGEQYIKNSDVTTGIYASQLAQEIGFCNGDRIISFDGIVPDKFNELQVDLIRTQAKEAKVLRNGDTVTVSIDPIYIPTILNTPGMFSYGIPFEVKEIPDTSLNASSGLMAKDRLLAINGNSCDMFYKAQEVLMGFKGDSIVATVARGNEIVLVPLLTDTLGRLQVLVNSNLEEFYTVTKKEYTLLSAIPAGINKAVTTVTNYFKELKLIFSPKTEAYKSVGSFITIGKIFPGTWDWHSFWGITAFLSVMLAVLNILPIPALDGGHLVFTLYEMVTGRKPSDKFLEYAQMVGMVLLLGLMVLAFGNDIFRLFN